MKVSVQSSIDAASKFFPSDNVAIRSKAVGVLYAVAFGCRQLKPEIVAMGLEHEPHKVEDRLLRLIASDVGEVLFYNHADIMEIANRIYDQRYFNATSPEMIYDAMSISDFVKSKVPGAEVFVKVNLERVVATVNQYINGLGAE